ncbi:cyclic pyranopterin monophosphate synthase MoaC [Rheinheimera faecalis]|jgi:cyclic pyranopterin phosphate synthase|uniref:cyclic pyranopterin monophosphate synthase MoaC n=1 Tax=Rheinheimera faecalis TaxID=2901141 RepID=UPI001E64E8CD|nr:cyclic pyranopterin monophosphate synthase MoaC [Rheinheimera faecalis]
MNNDPNVAATLTHLTKDGSAQMVNVGHKAVSSRKAIASAVVITTPEVVGLLLSASLKKGDAFACARIAGIMAAKKTSDLIPLCHPLLLTKVQVEFSADQTSGQVKIMTSCEVNGNTGVEMEALTAAAVSALTIHDMCKAVDPAIVITDIKLEEKTGGKSGVWIREDYVQHRDSYQDHTLIGKQGDF